MRTMWKKIQKVIMLVSGSVILLNPGIMTVHAETNTLDQETMIPITDSEIVEQTFTDEKGIQYELTAIEDVEMEFPERSKNVITEKNFDLLENAAVIPNKASITVEDDATGQEITAEVPQVSCQALEEHWQNDFSMPVTFHNYGADYYQIGGDYQIEITEENPNLDAYAHDLLQTAGLNPEYYQISQITWNGEAYQTETGEWCRDAVASGSKKLIDYLVTYQGDVIIPKSVGIQKMAVYHSVEDVNALQETEAPEKETAEASIQIIDTEPVPSFWRIFERAFLITISLGMVMIVLAVIIWIIYHSWKVWTEKKRFHMWQNIGGRRD